MREAAASPDVLGNTRLLARTWARTWTRIRARTRTIIAEKSQVRGGALATLVTLVGAVAVLGWSANGALALQSKWETGHAHKTRIIAATHPLANEIATFVGVDVQMDKGWKTYWHNPGNAGGIPPHFDWSKSINVADAAVYYPTPERMEDKTGITFGYKDAVMFPVRLRPIDPKSPMVFRLTFNFGVCDTICIPAFADHELTISPDAFLASSRQLNEALQALPEGVVTPPLALASELRVASDGVRWGPGGRSLEIVVEAGEGGGRSRPIDLFPHLSHGVFLDVPRVLRRDAGRITYSVPVLSDDGKQRLAGKDITVTLRHTSARQQTVRVPLN